ncbi:MAG: histone deacetylase [Oligoflexus sp.]
MTLLYQDVIFEGHKTGFHPESPKRTQNLIQRFEPWIKAGKVKQGTLSPIPESLLGDIHTREQIEQIKRLAAQGGGLIDSDTVVSSQSWQVALSAAGAAVSAVEAVLQGRDQNALCLIRPPGHHATHKQSMGFCLVNNVALAVKYAQKIHQLDRVLVVDWDVHHGNGTQDIFYDDESVFFYSIHRFPFYPGTGHETETGRGAGLGTTLNVPMSYGCSREEYLQAFRAGLAKAVQDFRPDLLILSAGFDAHKNDPVGSLGLETEDFRSMTQDVLALANSYTQGRLVSCLEGGYDIYALADSVEVHLDELQKSSGLGSMSRN